MNKVIIGKRKMKASSTLFGLFLEDINFACDGGLSTNMVANMSFGGVYPKKVYNLIQIYYTKKWPGVKEDRLRYWHISGGQLSSESGAAGKSEWYAQVSAQKDCRLWNLGFNGHGKYKNHCAMALAKEQTYHFSCYLRNHSYTGDVVIRGEDASGKALTNEIRLYVPEEKEGWQQVSGIVTGKRTALGKLVIEFAGEGVIDIDCVDFSTTDYWGAGDPKWSGGHFRKDLVQALVDLHPAFMRFPGGCIVEGVAPGNQYEWKKTIGPIIDREEKINLWASGVRDKGYTQTNQIGFYEYFLLCEDLGMEPLPVVWAGMNCQSRSKCVLPTESDAFKEEVVQNALDLIAFANGDPKTDEWAKIRADMGHPEPFGMKMIGIGNENHGDDYLEKFDRIKRAIDEKYDGITCIMTGGGEPDDERAVKSRDYARAHHPDVIVDEHFYKSVEWVMSQRNRYDSYPRQTAKVFLGEYAANEVIDFKHANTYQSALAEAAFLTGVERNSDVVTLCSYAPLFCLAECGQWNHNLIFFNPYDVLKTVNYQIQELFSSHQGSYVCETEETLSDEVNVSVMDSDDKLILKAVNTGDKEERLLAQTGLEDKKAQIFYIASADPLARNSITFTGKPRYEVEQKEKQMVTDAQGVLDLTMEPKSVYVVEVLKQ